MTSEIAVMNQRAIAMAADSAVTVIDGGKIMVRNEFRKLFNLAEGLPVGIMFFGVADLMGHPWDVLLEQYRTRSSPSALPHVRDYADNFLRSLDHLDTFFPPARQRDEYKRLITSVFRFIYRLSHYLQETGAEGPDEIILEQAIDLVWQRYQFYPDGRPRKDLDCFPEGFAATLEKSYGDIMTDMIGYAFAAFPLELKTRQQLRDICRFAVVKDLFLEDITGLVFGGYGADEPYPVVVTYNVSAVIGGVVKRARVDETKIDGDVHASITLFADSEVTYAFLRGIEMDLEVRMYDTFEMMTRATVDAVVDSFGNVDPAERESVRRGFQADHVPSALHEAAQTIGEYQRAAYIDPVLSVIEISTRQDLAETAEELVALNIFKKRIMAMDQTVGGAIDVAVISRDSGFTWAKRQGG